MAAYPTTSIEDSREAFKVFGSVPGVGKSLSVDLWELGMRSMDDLAKGDPEVMYEETKRLAGGSMDRCVLYVYRCAVAYAQNPEIDPELRKWWNWKDKR
ncbi:MAG: helix-hairpin-helix domain-containing protein [Planctomycetota bacterium]|nr:helix-hairpin-helix domain-containing protein [Planctomycetota bacterium]